MTTPPEVHADLIEFANSYQHSANQQSTLEPHKDAILLLRAKYASYEIITEELTKRGIKISVASVRKFCRRHNTAMRRLRHDIEAGARTPASAPQPNLPLPVETPAPPQGGTRPPLTAEIGKRGPRIARDQL